MSGVIVKPRRAEPSEMDGERVVTVLTEVERGLRCDRCGDTTRVDTHVQIDEHSPVVTLTGCTACRTGLYAPQ